MFLLKILIFMGGSFSRAASCELPLECQMLNSITNMVIFLLQNEQGKELLGQFLDNQLYNRKYDGITILSNPLIYDFHYQFLAPKNNDFKGTYLTHVHFTTTDHKEIFKNLAQHCRKNQNPQLLEQAETNLFSQIKNGADDNLVNEEREFLKTKDQSRATLQNWRDLNKKMAKTLYNQQKRDLQI